MGELSGRRRYAEGGLPPLSLPGGGGQGAGPAMIGRSRPIRLGTVPSARGFLNATLIRSMREELDDELERKEEAVAIYLSLLLAELARPDGLARYECCAAATEEELARRSPKGIGRRERLALYRTNADYHLLSLGLFDRPLLDRAGRGQGRYMSRKVMECRGINLYRLAAIQAAAVLGRDGELTQVLASLSSRFTRYCRVLRKLSGEKLSLVPQLTPGQEYHLLRAAHGTDRAGLMRRRWDHLLDTFGVWQRRRTQVARRRVMVAARLVAELDHSFSRSRFETRWCSAEHPEPVCPPAAGPRPAGREKEESEP